MVKTLQSYVASILCSYTSSNNSPIWPLVNVGLDFPHYFVINWHNLKEVKSACLLTSKISHLSLTSSSPNLAVIVLVDLGLLFQTWNANCVCLWETWVVLHRNFWVFMGRLNFCWYCSLEHFRVLIMSISNPHTQDIQFLKINPLHFCRATLVKHLFRYKAVWEWSFICQQENGPLRIFETGHLGLLSRIY